MAYLRMVVRRLRRGFSVPKNAPRADTGRGIRCKITRTPVVRAEDEPPLNNATIRISAVINAPDSKPIDIGAFLYNLQAIKPDDRDVAAISIIDAGSRALKGSFVPIMIAEARNATASIPISEAATDISDDFRKSEIGLPLPV